MGFLTDIRNLHVLHHLNSPWVLTSLTWTKYQSEYRATKDTQACYPKQIWKTSIHKKLNDMATRNQESKFFFICSNLVCCASFHIAFLLRFEIWIWEIVFSFQNVTFHSKETEHVQCGQILTHPPFSIISVCPDWESMSEQWNSIKFGQDFSVFQKTSCVTSGGYRALPSMIPVVTKTQSYCVPHSLECFSTLCGLKCAGFCVHVWSLLPHSPMFRLTSMFLCHFWTSVNFVEGNVDLSEKGTRVLQEVRPGEKAASERWGRWLDWDTHMIWLQLKKTASSLQ